jgi:hypothetical protein
VSSRHVCVMTDFYSLLEAKIDAIRGDPGRSRQVVYDLARYALKNKVYGRDPTLTPAQINEQMIALEIAIALVEARATGNFSSDKDSKASDDGSEAPVDKTAHIVDQDYDLIPPARNSRGRRDLVVLPPRNVTRRRADDEFDEDYSSARGARDLRVSAEAVALIQLLVNERKSRSRYALSWLDGLFRIVFIAVIGLGVYLYWAGGTERLAELAGLQPAPELPIEVPVAPPPEPPVPSMLLGSVARPTVYGVYAIHDNNLVALSVVPTTPVDPRTRHLLQITEPSSTVFADGRLVFTVYRRDLVTSAPETVPVRFAARIASTMRYGPGGTLVTAKPDVESWLIYSAGFNFRVLPVPDDQEMILIRPDDPDLVLPPGRYILLLNDQPYDFTVAGEVTDPRFCVEGVATPRGPVFYVCKEETHR